MMDGMVGGAAERSIESGAARGLSYARGRGRGWIYLLVLAVVVGLVLFEHRLTNDIVREHEAAVRETREMHENNGIGEAAQAAGAELAASESAIARYEELSAYTVTAIFALLLMEAAFVVRPMFQRLSLTQTAVARSVMTDPATGCLNRASFHAEVAREYARARRFGFYFSLVLLDLDGLKSINALHGQAGGDTAIGAMAAKLVRYARQTDVLGRIDGDQFGILMPHTSTHQARLGAERIQEAIAEELVKFGKSELRVTVSMGITVLLDGDGSVSDVFNRAELALGKAKASGANQITIDEN